MPSKPVALTAKEMYRLTLILECYDILGKLREPDVWIVIKAAHAYSDLFAQEDNGDTGS